MNWLWVSVLMKAHLSSCPRTCCPTSDVEDSSAAVENTGTPLNSVLSLLRARVVSSFWVVSFGVVVGSFSVVSFCVVVISCVVVNPRKSFVVKSSETLTKLN